jgi:hypothetical protein
VTYFDRRIPVRFRKTKPSANAATSVRSLTAIGLWLLCAFAAALATPAAHHPMEWIELSDDGHGFELTDSHKQFTPCGFNYDHDDQQRLIEDYWDTEWDKVKQAFHDMKQLGANVVRIHLQIGRFMNDPYTVNRKSMARLHKLVALAEREGLYLDVTGLSCYKDSDTPLWYDRLPESERWAVQARFWDAISVGMSKSPAVFCYNLMNEPVVPATKETSWHPQAWLDNRYYVENLTKDPDRRSRSEIAQSWLKTMSAAIRRHDRNHLITFGTFVIFEQTRSLPIGAAPAQLKDQVDFFSLHYYPTDNSGNQAREILSQLSVGKPIVIEETAPLNCSVASLEEFITASKPYVCGWMFFYWGKPLQQCQESNAPQDAVQAGGLQVFRRLATQLNHP